MRGAHAGQAGGDEEQRADAGQEAVDDQEDGAVALEAGDHAVERRPARGVRGRCAAARAGAGRTSSRSASRAIEPATTAAKIAHQLQP